MATSNIGRLQLALLAATCGTALTTSWAQTSTVSAPPTGEEMVKMDPFDVPADRGNSYSTLNSNSITRFNTELEKMPLSADIFDQAFMSDVGATSVEAMIQNYSAGAGYGSLVPSSAGVAEPGDHVSHANLQLRGFTAEYMERDSLMPVGSFYNPGSTGSNFSSNFDMERVEVINGPQSLLYSGGGGGGVINVVSKQARLSQPASGSVKYQIDQWGTKLGQLDYGVGNDLFAIRLALIQEDQDTRRINLGGTLEGYYAQVAAKIPKLNTTVRITGEETTYNQILGTSVSLTAASTSADSRNGSSLNYLIATNQLGANTLNAAGLPNGSGSIDNGLVNWADVNSYGGNTNSNLTVNKWTTLSIDTQWNSWLSSQFSTGYNDFYFDLATASVSFYAPQSTSNPLGVWAAGNTPADLAEPGRAKAVRYVMLATNDFFNGKAHSQTIAGGDFLRQDAAQLQYEWYQADSNFNPIYSSAITSNNGRTPIPKQYWAIDSGFSKYPFAGARSPRITVNGVNYVRMLENIITPSLESPTNPLGLSNTNTYEISKAFNQGFFLVNNTQWFDGKVDTLVGLRRAAFFSESQQSGDPDNQENGKGWDYNLGIDYSLLSWLRAYVSTSNNYDIPEAISHSPDGSLPGIGHSTGEEVGLKFNTPNGTLSGSLALYHANGKNEQFEISATIENDIAPTGLNGTPTRGQYLSVDRTTTGAQMIVTANPTPNFRLRMSLADTGGKILDTKAYPLEYSDQFYENSQGQVTYADGTLVYVPPTYNSKAPTTTSTSAGAVPLTVAMMNNSASVYYANPVNPTGAISGSSAVATVLKAADPVHGSILTGAIGLPISALQITPPFAVPASIVAAQAGDKTLGYPQLSGNITGVYTFSNGWIKGFDIGATLSANWKYEEYYYYPAGVTATTLNRQIFAAPNMGRVDLIAGYTHRFNKITWTSQLNIYNLLNHYDVVIFPNEVTGWTSQSNLTANFFGQPRSYQWTNTLSF